MIGEAMVRLHYAIMLIDSHNTYHITGACQPDEKAKFLTPKCGLFLDPFPFFH